MSEFGQILASLIGSIAVIDLIAVILQGTKNLADTNKGKLGRALSLGLLGGLFGMYATISGYTMDNGIIITIRDVGPMMAGCLGGPLSGLLAGVIAGVHRFMQGMPDIMAGTTIPCTISTIVIGLICGALFKRFEKRKNRGLYAFIIAVIMEVLHLGSVFIYKSILTDVISSIKLVLGIAPSFLLANGIAFGLLVYITEVLDKYKRDETNKEKIEAELDTASNIQKSMLPEVTQKMIDDKRFDLYATMIPAKQVGGDFYDHYYIDDDHFAITIADVSGKGVPAALFMARTKTIIKNNLQLGLSLKEAITKSNEQLAEDNKENMFVSAWIGILEISTGKLTYLNAGHNPPVLRKANGEAGYIKDRSGLILAVDGDSQYKIFEMNMDRGDILYAYTDGVVEANDEKEKLYGEDRLLEVLKIAEGNTEETCKLVKKDVDKFVENSVQFDDITMIALKYDGGNV